MPEITKNVPWKISDIILTYTLTFATAILTVGILMQIRSDVSRLFYSSVLQSSVTITSLACVYYIITQKYRLPFFISLGIELKNLRKNFLQGVISAVLIVFATTAVSLIFSLISTSVQNPYSSYTPEKMKIISVFAILSAPIYEEILFRGFIQPVFTKYAGIFWGIIITSLFFAISHTQYLNYDSAFAGVFAIGIILGYTRQFTGSVMPGIFAHLINNLLAVLSLS